ncbi:MAG: protein kinase domain-containing protein [Saccharofermentanales bacterium]
MKTGIKIDDRYIVQEQLGKETFLVMNVFSGVRWILKSMPLLVKKETIELLQKIRHPSLPRIFEMIDVDNITYFLLEYIDGISLSEHCRESGGKLSYINACEYMATISRAIYFLHTQNSISLLHLDIKPGNIILMNNNLPCLIDYGTAQDLNGRTNGKSEVNSFYGTPGYAPPEMIQGMKPTEQSDIFMIGMTLFRLVSGIEPNASLRIEAKLLTSMMPAAIAKIISRCVMNDPGDRYGNAGELAYDLEIACDTTLSHDTYQGRECGFQAVLEDTAAAREYNHSISADKENRSEFKGKRKNSQDRVICIWDNSQFAVELAYVLAKQKKKVLLMDVDLLSPGIDLLVELRDNVSKNSSSLLGDNSFSDLMEEYAKKRMNIDTIRMFAQKTQIETLSCICGNYRMEDYEYYSTEGLVEIIKTASMGYDFVVISCGKFIYDEFTCVAQICADKIFIPINANGMQFREFNRYINFLSGRKQLESEKILFVGFDYHPNEDLSHGTCDELCNGSFIGIISYSQKRRMMQGTRKPYINAMESKIEKQYLKIIKKSELLIS